ncbi:unnamed protein product [Peronospora belbahrii]|uniref:Uncharacterized protein n=1 Tax=Peronospora belbahrii TaxID=622444 RepID=A0ABN8CRM2_9STRA|nr:unnamed protein product [Peronospora belbahrii]
MLYSLLDIWMIIHGSAAVLVKPLSSIYWLSLLLSGTPSDSFCRELSAAYFFVGLIGRQSRRPGPVHPYVDSTDQPCHINALCPRPYQNEDREGVEVLLGVEAFHCSYLMRIMLTRKDLLVHVEGIKVKIGITDAWLMNDAKALSIIAQGVKLPDQAKFHFPALTKSYAALRKIYNRSIIHNRVVTSRV